MKRAAPLASLSRDHHQALRVAQKLRRSTTGTVAETREAFLGFWDPHGSLHFRLEEELLLPAFAAHGDPHHELVARTLCDHLAIRQQANQLAADVRPTLESLQQLGMQLATHVRMEERELFPLIEQTIPADQLELTARALQEAETRRHTNTAAADRAARNPSELVDLNSRHGVGPVWGIASEDLNATLLAWAPGNAIAEHINEHRDVLLVITHGDGTATVAAHTHELTPGHALLIPKGTRRSIQTGAGGLRYLSIHVRRGPLQIEP